MGTKEFLYRLFFTRDDDLDMLQVAYLLCIFYFFVAFSFKGMGLWHITATDWEMFKWVFNILAITGIPTWLVGVVSKIVGTHAERAALNLGDDEPEPTKSTTELPHNPEEPPLPDPPAHEEDKG